MGFGFAKLNTFDYGFYFLILNANNTILYFMRDYQKKIRTHYSLGYLASILILLYTRKKC